MKKLKKKRGKMRWAVSKRCEEPPKILDNYVEVSPGLIVDIGLSI